LTANLQELYQEVILDHHRRPRNRGTLAEPVHRAEGSNPLCGDQLTIYVRLNGDVIEEVAFEGSGCAISTAAASLMTEAIKGKTVSEAQALFERYHRVLTEEGGEADASRALGKLAVLSGVRQYPVRVKCATLCWHALKAALEDRQEVVTTE
jgi:nitrogen fixation protein NifU and related proteins